MDGVLFDSGPAHLESWLRLAEEESLEGIDAAWFRSVFGRTGKEILELLFQGDITESEIARLDNRKEWLYREAVRGRVDPPAGLMALIEGLARDGWTLGIGSAGPRENVDLIVESLGLESWVSATVSSRDVTKGKPDPEVFLKAAAAMGVDPERCVVVEDATVGLRAARAAGMGCVAITTTHAAESLAFADRVIDSFEELDAAEFARILDGKNGNGDPRS